MAIDKNAVAVPAQSKDLDTTRVTTTYGLVHRQVISIADPENPTGYVTLTGSSLNVNVSNASIAVSAASLPLPTGAATATLQTTGNNTLSNIDTKLGGTLSVNVGLTDAQLRASDVPISFTRLASGTDSVTIVPSGTQAVSGTVSATQSGTWNVNNISGTVSLPTGASTATLQTTGNTSLNSIDTKTPSLSSGRVPVESNLVQALTDSQLRATPVPVSFARLSSATDNISAVQSGTWNITNISGTVSLPTGAATESTLVALSAKVVNGYSFHHSASNATTTIKSGAGVLKRVTVNTLGSALNTCTIYDNTAGSGTIIAVIDPTLARGIFEYDLVFNTGLTIVTATGTAADLTIVYQ